MLSFANQAYNVFNTGGSGVTINASTIVANTATFKNQYSTTVGINATSATTNLDLSSAEVFEVNMQTSTALVFQNPPVAGVTFSFSVITTNVAANLALAFPSNVLWAGGLGAPSRSTAVGPIDTWTFYTTDGGAHWTGTLSIEAAQ